MTCPVTHGVYCCVMRIQNRRIHSLICELCGSEFQSTHKTQRFCSHLCSARRPRGTKLRHVVNRCEWCGNQYTPRTSAQRYCSVLCGNAAYRDRRKAKSKGQIEAAKLQRKVNYTPKGTYNNIGISEVREGCGLAPIIQEEVECLTCGNLFMSWDKKHNRRCTACLNSEDYENISSSGYF